MPFFVKDWLAATMHWASAERGAYISYLAFQWVNRALPADETQLARIGGITLEDFPRVWATVGKKFDSDERGLFNKRLEHVRKEAMRLRDARAFGASVANEKRSAKRSARHDAANDADFNAERDAERIAQTTHTSTNTNTEKEKKKHNGAARRSARAQRVSRETVNDEVVDEDWIRFKLIAPKRAGSQPLERGRKAWHARRAEGHEASVMIAGGERWARYVNETHQDPRYVMQLVTFLGPEKHFLADWEVPLIAANDERWSPPAEDIDPP
jgi:uncharacterized protein YdaU (DUF1376 family)